MSGHGLWLDDLDLTGGSIAGAEFTLHALAEGTNWGASEPEVTVALSMLADGSRVEYDREGNRTIPIRVMVKAPNALGLALGEAALAQRMRREVPLIWQPPKSWNDVRTVFDVRMSSMSFEFDDQAELRGERVYKLELTCAPWARSEDLTVVEALPEPAAEATVETVDDCSSTTGWAAQMADTPAWGTTPAYSAPTAATSFPGGAVASLSPDTIPGQITPSYMRHKLTRTGSITLIDTPYLILTVETVWARPLGWRVYLDGISLPIISSIRTSNSAYRIVAKVPDGKTSATGLAIETQMGSPFGGPVGLAVYDVTRSSTASTSKPRQQTRIVDVGGTERTSGKVVVASRVAEPLALTVIHTSPLALESMGYTPGSIDFRVSGNDRTSAAYNLSGSQEPIHPNPVIYSRPNDTLPEGPYSIVALLHSPVATTERIYWTIGDLAQGFTDWTFTGGRYDFVPLTVAHLPVIRSSAAEGETNFEIQRAASSVTITLDDILPFWMGKNCGLTVMHDAGRRVELDSSPITGETLPWTGDQLDGGDRRHPGNRLIVPGEHPLMAGQMRVWTGTTGAVDPAVSAEFYPRWHTHAAE